MGLGMSAGLGAFAVAGLGTAFLCLTLVGLDLMVKQQTRLMSVEIVAERPHVPVPARRGGLRPQPDRLRAARDRAVGRGDGEVSRLARPANVARRSQRAADARCRRRDRRGLGTPQARMTAAKSSRGPRDEVVTAPADRREVVLRAIRQARERLALSLFRCNDKAVFDELKQARERGVSVDVLVTSRSGGSKQAAAQTVARARGDGRRDSSPRRSRRQVPRQVSGRRRWAGARRVAELHAQVLREDHRCDRDHARSGGRERPSRPDRRRLQRRPDARPVVASTHRRPGARASPVHRDHRAGAVEHSADRQEGVGSGDDRVAAISVARPACAWTCTTGSVCATCDRTARSCSSTTRSRWSAGSRSIR